MKTIASYIRPKAGIIAFELAGKFCLEVRSIEMCDGARSANTVGKIGEILLDVVSQWVQGTYSGYYYSPLFHK